MKALAFLAFIILAFFIGIIKDNPRRFKKMYTTDGYPRAELIVVNFDNVPQGVEVEMSSTENSLIFNGNGVNRELLYEDIVDITLQTVNNETEVSKFSYQKAVIGTVILGTVGALAGISGKKKQDLEMLIISYIKDEDIRYLTFLQQTKKEYPINTEAFFLKEAIKRIESIRKGDYTPLKLSEQ